MSAFSEAITQSMIQGLDPMNSITRDMATGMIKKMQDEHVSAKATLIESIGAKLQQAKDQGQDGRVIDAYDKLLQQVTS